MIDWCFRSVPRKQCGRGKAQTNSLKTTPANYTLGVVLVRDRTYDTLACVQQMETCIAESQLAETTNRGN